MATIDGILDNATIQERLGYLWCRWQDEKQYEDWCDYDEAIRKMVSDVLDLPCRRTVRVGFVVTIEGADVQFKMTSRMFRAKVVGPKRIRG